MTERPVVFSCRGDSLVGLVHEASAASALGVLIVVGGPQYRVGAHRQYVLFARALADAGVPVFRFDYRGMGDSDGGYRGFEYIRDDIVAAIDAFVREVKHVRSVVLWGLCDGAAAAAMTAPTDQRISGLILLNPWIRSPSTLARARLLHYYPRRFLDGAAWRRLLGGDVPVMKALAGIGRLAVRAFTASDVDAPTQLPSHILMPSAPEDRRPLEKRLVTGLGRFSGHVLLILSGNDLTAAELQTAIARSRQWRALLCKARVTRVEVPDADHTFSRRPWREQVIAHSEAWIRALPSRCTSQHLGEASRSQ